MHSSMWQIKRLTSRPPMQRSASAAQALCFAFGVLDEATRSAGEPIHWI